jgi:hypothetical protein
MGVQNDLDEAYSQKTGQDELLKLILQKQAWI